jgi:hypothetical protein
MQLCPIRKKLFIINSLEECQFFQTLYVPILEVVQTDYHERLAQFHIYQFSL